MNPFTPTFGKNPPVLVGRDDDLDDFRLGLQSGPGAPERATLLTGLRGTGKTVMLNAYEQIAGMEGWLVISETATRGLIDRLIGDHLPRLLREQDPRQTRSTVTGVTVAGVGLERNVTDRHPEVTPNLRSQLNALADLMDEHGSGVLITVDEIHRGQLDDLRQLGTTIQHVVREERAVAFVAAGLPSSVSDLLNDAVLTFLRRADRRHLRTVSPADVAEGLEVPIIQAGRSITTPALEIAVRGTAGYPFLIQLVGLHTWRAAGTSTTIEQDHAIRGVQQARRKIGQLVHAAALADLSDVDRTFLAAMAVDDGPSRMGDVQERLDVSQSYAGKYRRRLIDAEMIETRGRGLVNFTLPGLRSYLRDHAAASPWGTDIDLTPPPPN